jgi:ribosomal protein L34
MMRPRRRHYRHLWSSFVLAALLGTCSGPPQVTLQNDEAAGVLRVSISGREALVYQYAPTHDMPHYWPLNSPSGQNMLVQQTEPYPHHRSFWFADTVRFKGEREVSTYNALYSGVQAEENTYSPPYKDRIKHRSFRRMETQAGRAVIDSESVWEMDGGRPLVAEDRHLVISALGGGEYLLDVTFTLTAENRDVEFVSDDVHYAWPYLRVQTRYSGENGGTITSDSGAVGQEATNMQEALWIDYSNSVEGRTEGVAVFQWPDGRAHRWLTREYGCFGPRRPDDRSGKPFILKKGESLTQRVGVLVHQGDVRSGRVKERYEEYVTGGWQE